MPDLLSSCDEMTSHTSAEKLFIYGSDTDTETICMSDTLSHIGEKWPSSKLAQKQSESKSKPEIIKRLRNQSVRAGGQIYLELEAELNEGSGYFYQNGELLRNNERTNIVNTGLRWILRIEPASSRDCGEYTFQATNTSGRAESKCLVNIERRCGYPSSLPSKTETAIAPFFEEIMEDAQIAIGGNTAFQVQVKGTPPIKISWKLNNKIITNSDKSRDLIFMTRSTTQAKY